MWVSEGVRRSIRLALMWFSQMYQLRLLIGRAD